MLYIHSRRVRTWAGVGSAVLIAVGAVLLSAQAPSVKIGAPAGADFFGLTPQFALSPDGRHVVMVVTRPNEAPSLWVQPVSGGAPRRLPGTQQASYPFWSADGRQVGFFAEAKLKRIELDAPAPIVVCDAPTGRGGTWNREGVIVFTSGIGDPLRRVAASGGAVTPVTKLDTPRENSHRWPSFLPDGTHVLYWAGAGTAPPALKVASLDGSAPVTVGPSASNAAFGHGHIFHAAGNALVALPFDPVTRTVTGASRPIVTPISADAGSFFASFAVGAAGPVLYTQGTARPLVLTWFDRSGVRLSEVGPPGQYTNVNISPDGSRLAVSLTAGTPPNRDIWALEAAGRGATRLTNDPAVDATPVWAPDGRSLVFSSQRAGPYQMYRRSLESGTDGPDELVLPSTVATIATDWSSDGRFIAYTRTSGPNGLDIWVLPMTGDRTPYPLVESRAADDNGMFSPDASMIAYQSGISGSDQIYVRPFPDAGEPRLVSPSGGTQPRWRRDGSELFYLAPDGSVVFVPIAREPGRNITVSTPRTIVPATMSLVIRQWFAVSPDGERVITPVVDRTSQPVITGMLPTFN